MPAPDRFSRGVAPLVAAADEQNVSSAGKSCPDLEAQVLRVFSALGLFRHGAEVQESSAIPIAHDLAFDETQRTLCAQCPDGDTKQILQPVVAETAQKSESSDTRHDRARSLGLFSLTSAPPRWLSTFLVGKSVEKVWNNFCGAHACWLGARLRVNGAVRHFLALTRIGVTFRVTGHPPSPGGYWLSFKGKPADKHRDGRAALALACNIPLP